MDANASALIEPKTDDKTKADTKADTKPKTKASKPKPKPSDDAIKKAMATLEAAGMMDAEEQLESVIAYKLQSLYSKAIGLAAQVNEKPEEGDCIGILPNGEFFFAPAPEDDDEDEDDKAAKKAKKKAKKAKKAKANDDNSDWKADAKILASALIKFVKDNDHKAADIHKMLSKHRATPPALTTVYNWLNGKAVPNRKYHRKLRSILGLNVG
jgi:hypothetical protein